MKALSSGIAQRAVGVVAILEQVRNAERAEPRVDAGEEVRRVRITLDRPELQSLDMRGRRAELPAGEDLDLDPAVGGLLDRFLQLEAVQVLHVALRHDAVFQREIGGLRPAWSRVPGAASSAAASNAVVGKMCRGCIVIFPPWRPAA